MKLKFLSEAEAEIQGLIPSSIGAANASDLTAIQGQISTIQGQLAALQTAQSSIFTGKTFTLTISPTET